MVSTDTKTKSRKFMLKFLQRIIAGLVDTRSDLERYVASRHPQSAAEIDHIVKQWNHRNSGAWL